MEFECKVLSGTLGIYKCWEGWKKGKVDGFKLANICDLWWDENVFHGIDDIIARIE